MQEISLRSPKEELVSSALELIDEQANELEGIRQDRRALFFIAAFFLTTTFLF